MYSYIAHLFFPYCWLLAVTCLVKRDLQWVLILHCLPVNRPQTTLDCMYLVSCGNSLISPLSLCKVWCSPTSLWNATWRSFHFSYYTPSSIPPPTHLCLTPMALLVWLFRPAFGLGFVPLLGWIHTFFRQGFHHSECAAKSACVNLGPHYCHVSVPFIKNGKPLNNGYKVKQTESIFWHIRRTDP